MQIYMIGQKGIPATGGGVERHVEELATRLAKKGEDVFVYARKGYTKTTPSTYNGVNILYTPTIYTKHLEAIIHTITSMVDLLRRKVDIIHIHAIGPSLLIPFAKILKPRAKIIATVHCADYFHQKWGWFARFSLRLGERMASYFADEVITVSNSLEQYLWNAYHCDAHYIPNGVPLPKLTAKTSYLSEWDLEPDNYIVAISRLVRHKGLHYLIEAYKAIETDKKLVIVGSTEYTDDYVEELYKRAACNPNIIFTGKQTGAPLAALFQHASLFVQPSQSEGLSIALLEALSYNQAVLISDIPENLEAAGGNGFIFKQGNIQDLAKQLAHILEHPKLLKAQKQNGREYVKQSYNWRQITNQTTGVYKEALEKQFTKQIIPTA